MCGNPKQRNRFEQREGNEFVPIHRFDDSAESGLFCAFGTQLKVSVGAFVKRHERWAECQVHHGGGVECAEQFVPKLRFCAGQISGFNKACNAERIGFHHERYRNTDKPPDDDAPNGINGQNPCFFAQTEGKHFADCCKQTELDKAHDVRVGGGEGFEDLAALRNDKHGGECGKHRKRAHGSGSIAAHGFG